MTESLESKTRITGAPVRAAIALGGNLGNSQKILSDAMQAIDREPGIAVIARSPLYKTAPIGPPQPDYLNACVVVETVLAARSLLYHLFATETRFGRIRQERWGARSLDLDLLLYGEQIIDLPGLTVPHPHLHERSFVLVPLNDIAPDCPHPIFGKTIAQLLAQLPPGGVEKFVEATASPHSPQPSCPPVRNRRS